MEKLQLSIISYRSLIRQPSVSFVNSNFHISTTDTLAPGKFNRVVFIIQHGKVQFPNSLSNIRHKCRNHSNNTRYPE